MDLKKSYDTVQHVFLWKYVHAAGVGRDYVEFMQNVCEGQIVRVAINCNLSEPYPYGVGVVQGGVKSPMMFNIFINSLSEVLYSNGLCVNVPRLRDTPSVSGRRMLRRVGLAFLVVADLISVLSYSYSMLPKQCSFLSD